MKWIEWVGFLAIALNIIGNWLLTKRKQSGWVVRITCNAVQFAYALLIWSPSYVVNAIVFSFINAVGMYRGRQLDLGHEEWCRVMRAKSCNCGRFA